MEPTYLDRALAEAVHGAPPSAEHAGLTVAKMRAARALLDAREVNSEHWTGSHPGLLKRLYRRLRIYFRTAR